MPTRLKTILFGGLLLVVFSHSVGAEPVSNPEKIKIPANPRIWKDVLKEHLAWCERLLIQPYLERNQAHPPSEEDLGFIREALATMVEQPDLESDHQAFQLGADLLFQRSKDPLVVMAYAISQKERGSQAIAELDTALQVAQSLPGKKALAWMVARTRILSYGTPDKELGPQSAMVSLTREVVQDGTFAGEDFDVFVRLFLGSEMDDYRQQNQSLYEPLADSKQMPVWAREAMRGQIEVAKAWQMRGNEFAGKVTGDGWKGFSQHLQSARRALEKSYAANPQNPIAATEMISVIMGGDGRPGETERIWFDRAIEAQFDYFPAYAHLRWAYRPRWGGSVEKMLDLAKACASTQRFDTVVPEFFFNTTSMLVTEEKMDWQELFRGKIDVSELMVSLSQQRLDDPARLGCKDANLGYLVANAFLAGDFITASTALKKIQFPISSTIGKKLWQFHIAYDIFEQQMSLANSPGGGEFFEAESLLRQHNTANAFLLYEAALAKASPEDQNTIQLRYDHVKLSCAYESGEWTSLEVNKSKSYWFFGPNLSESWVTGNEDSNKPSLMQKLDLDLGDDVGVRGEFVLPEKLSAQFAYIFELYCGEKKSYVAGWLCCRISSTISDGVFAVSVFDGLGKKFVADTTLPLHVKNHVLLLVRDGSFSMTINGTKIAEAISLPSHTNRYPAVGFGFAVPPAVDGVPMTWEIRKLPDQEIPPSIPEFLQRPIQST